MIIFEKDIEIFSNFEGEYIQGIIEDVCEIAGLFVKFEKPVPTNTGANLEKCWIKVPNTEYREVEGIGILPKKQFITKENF